MQTYLNQEGNSLKMKAKLVTLYNENQIFPDLLKKNGFGFFAINLLLTKTTLKIKQNWFSRFGGDRLHTCTDHVALV